MRKDYFLAGLGIRTLMLMIFLFLNHYDKYNDMSEIIYYALYNMLHGQNPYSVVYELEWGSGTFTQPFNYGPVTLVFLLPAMLLPFWYNSFWLGMFVMNNVYAFLLSEYLCKHLATDLGLQKLRGKIHKEYHSKSAKTPGSFEQIEMEPRVNRFIYYTGVFMWMIPFGTLVVTNFLLLPIYLATLAFGNRDNPYKCGLYLFLGALSYQLVWLFVPAYYVYHFRKDFKNIIKLTIGGIPSFILFIIFVFWGPGGIIYSLFLYTSEMGYYKCPSCNHSMDKWFVFSVPKLLYVLSDGKIRIGNQARLVLAGVIVMYALYYLMNEKPRRVPELFIQKSEILAVVGFVLTNNYGQIHYIMLAFVPAFIYYQIKNPDFRKEFPIGLGINNWEQFERYLLKYHRLPP